MDMFSFLWDKCPGVRLLCYMVSVCLNLILKKLHNCFSYYLPTSDEEFSFSISLPIFSIVTIFYFDCSDRRIVMSHIHFAFL